MGRLKARTDKLEREKEDLRDELSRSKNQLKPPMSEALNSENLREIHNTYFAGEPLPSPRKPLADLSPNKAAARGGKDNGNDYEKLAARHAKAIAALEKTQAVARRYLQDKNKWMAYAESLERKIERLKHAKGSHDKSVEPSTARILPREEASGSAEADEADDIRPEKHTRESSSSISFISNPDPVQPVGVLDTAPEPGTPLRRASSTPVSSKRADVVGSDTQSTEGNPEIEPKQHAELPPVPSNEETSSPGRIHIKQEPSSDTPVVVSERCLRKRKHEDSEPREAAHKIKRESSEDSEPIISHVSLLFSPDESVDFDAGPIIRTPKKPRRLTEHQFQIDAAAMESDAPPQLDIPLAILRDEDGWTAMTLATQSTQERLPTSGPDDAPGEAGAQYIRKLDHGVAEVAEDGYNPQQGARPRTTAARRGRLDALLSGAAPPLDRSPVLPRPNRRAHETSPDRRAAELELNIPNRELPFEKIRSTGGEQQLASAASHYNTPPSTGATRRVGPRAKIDSPSTTKKPAAVPIRKQPLIALSLSDFKVNPKFNEGFNFAYSEVVRNKSDRAELPGCTDENCCGKKFRDMAMNERDAVGPALLQQVANIELVERFLGDDAHRLRGMSREEKEDLWVEAKVRDLANRFGRHKHRYTRRPSPPGFWNPDMPSTQELAREREETDRAVRKQVEERYRDALRGNGRWLFRDE